VTSAFIKPFVRSAVVDEQRIFTRATLVLDEQGIGQATWNLTQQAAFVVVDRKGLVVDVILGAPSEADFERSFQVLRDLIALE
jgi:predicted transcriptional regulator